MKNKVTIKDVAKAAGVSYQLVGAILSKKKSSIRFSEATRDKVEKVAKELNYQSDIFARSFKSQKSFLIGVLCSQANSFLFGDLLRGIQEELSKHGYTPLFLSFSTVDEAKNNLQTFASRKIDGLIINAPNDKEFIELLNQMAIPKVEIFGHFLEKAVSVNQNMYQVGYLATQHLIEQGHKKIGLLTHEFYRKAETSPGENWDAYDQFKGYCDALEKFDITPQVFDHKIKGGCESWEQIWFKGGTSVAEQIFTSDVTAIVCYDDHQAYALTKYATEKSIPKKLAIIGYHNLSICHLASPTLSSIYTPHFEVGNVAAKKIISLLADDDVASEEISPKLVCRESTSTEYI